MNSLGFLLLIGSSSLGILGYTCVLLLVGCSVLERSVASVLVQQTAPTPNNPPGEEHKYNQGSPETTNQSTAKIPKSS